MINIKDHFPNLDQEGYFDTPPYNIIVSLFGEVLIASHDKDYHGDSFYLLKKQDKYGYLSLSWGSCSGCDALQACNNYDELQQLVSRLETSINWQNSFEDLQQWIKSRDWETTIEWHTGAKEFLTKFREYPLRAFK